MEDRVSINKRFCTAKQGLMEREILIKDRPSCEYSTFHCGAPGATSLAHATSSQLLTLRCSEVLLFLQNPYPTQPVCTFSSQINIFCNIYPHLVSFLSLLVAQHAFQSRFIESMFTFQFLCIFILFYFILFFSLV